MDALARPGTDAPEDTTVDARVEARVGAPVDGTPAPSTRRIRVDTRARNPRWQPAPLKIDMSVCINCDTCLRHCPPQFGAIFNHGMDVIILPELCSGCGKCLPPVCPVDCIHPDPSWSPSPEDWWEHPFGPEDPYLEPR